MAFEHNLWIESKFTVIWKVMYVQFIYSIESCWCFSGNQTPASTIFNVYTNKLHTHKCLNQDPQSSICIPLAFYCFCGWITHTESLEIHSNRLLISISRKILNLFTVFRLLLTQYSMFMRTHPQKSASKIIQLTMNQIKQSCIHCFLAPASIIFNVYRCQICSYTHKRLDHTISNWSFA